MSTRDTYGRPPARFAQATEPAADDAVSRRSLLRLRGSRPEPDQAAATARRVAAWQRDGHDPLARQLEPAAAVVAELLELRAGERVLDAGAGDGNLALAAAAAGASAAAVDLAEPMVERGRARTGPAVEWRVADVQELPYPDASFDAVGSAFGADLAPNARLAAAELVRVVRPGGRVAIAAWVPRGLPGRMEELVETVEPRPAGVPRASAWGVEAVARRRLEPLLGELQLRTRTLRLEFDSADEALAALAQAHPLDEAQRARLRPAFDRMLASCNNLPPRVRLDARYLIALGVRPA